MARKKTERPVVPGRVFLLALLPFAIPAGFTLLLALGFNWPRDLAPGSGLKLAGFVATAATALAVWGYSVRGLDDRQARGRAAAGMSRSPGLEARCPSMMVVYMARGLRSLVKYRASSSAQPAVGDGNRSTLANERLPPWHS